MNIAWDKAKDEVFRENTAQAIQEQLERLDNQAEKYQKRWIWELFQNALDAAPQGAGIEIRLRLRGDFEFGHNGAPFSANDILHLVFHGSTKREKEDSIGRYGTGFLTTHVISKKVRVSGSLETEQAFDFLLDRTGTTSRELASAMEFSEQRLRESVDRNITPDHRWTSFEYGLSSEAQSVVRQTLLDVRAIAPIVLVFNPRIEKLEITDDKSCVFSVRREKVTETIALATVDMIADEEKTCHFVVVEKGDVAVMVPLSPLGDGLAIGIVEGLPKLFVAFPLVGTETLPIPFIVNCPKAKPTPDRNGLYLDAEPTADNSRNKAFLESAWGLYADVVNWAAQRGLEEPQRLAKFSCAPDFEWLDRTWFDELVVNLLQTAIVRTPLVRVGGGQKRPPTEVIFPDPPVPEVRDDFRDIMEAFHGSIVPDSSVARKWEVIVSAWSVLPDFASVGIKTENLASVAVRVSSCGTKTALQRILDSRGSSVGNQEFLNALCDLLLRSGAGTTFEKIPLLPNQLGSFKLRKSLKRDDSLDEELKDIAHELSLPVRDGLLDGGMSDQVQDLLNPYGQENLIATLLRNCGIQATLRLSDSQYSDTNAKFFGWLVRNHRMDEVKSFPVISARDETPQLVDPKDQLILPAALWTADLKVFADLFPDRNILSDIYAAVLGPADGQWLEENGFLVREPLRTEIRNLSRGDLESLLDKPLSAEQEEKEHAIVDVEVVDLCFLTSKDRGILDTVRSSRLKGTRFLLFLFDYLIPNCAGAMEYTSVNCACGETHSIHRALWLPPIKDRQWVNVRKGHYGPPTAQNLARLWRDEPSLGRKLENDFVMTFLQRIGVSASEILMNLSGGDDRAMQKALVSLLNAAGNNSDQLLRLAEVLTSDPELIEEFEERKLRRERNRLNQELGALVETVFRSLFQSPEVSDLGLRIERTGRGSDFAIENDLVEGWSGVVVQR